MSDQPQSSGGIRFTPATSLQDGALYSPNDFAIQELRQKIACLEQSIAQHSAEREQAIKERDSVIANHARELEAERRLSQAYRTLILELIDRLVSRG